MLYGLSALAALLLTTYLLTRLTGPRSAVELGLTSLLYASAQIVALGFALSSLGALASLELWSLGSLVILVLSVGLTRLMRLPPWPRPPSLGDIRSSFRHLSPLRQAQLTMLGLTAGLLGVINFGLALFIAPGNWDSMAYHLARMAYYLQQGSLDTFDANYWAQVVHPKNSTVLLTYAYLIGQRNENLTQLVQYLSYWMATLAVYGIARQGGHRRSSSLAAALVFALLTASLMQATTTQNDMLLAAFAGASVYFLLAYRKWRRQRDLFLVALALALGVGSKSSFSLFLPSLLIVGAYAFLAGARVPRQAFRGDLPALVAAGAACTVAFVLPAGYWDNYRLFGHPVGPPEVRQMHSFEGQPLSYALAQGGKNVLRYGVDFLSLDGLPTMSQTVQVQSALRAPLIKVFGLANLDLEDSEATRTPFDYFRWPLAHEDWSYWGVMGFGLVWPAALLALIGVTRSPASRVLALAALVFVLAQAFAGPYDPWRGRYFIMAGPLAVPCVAALLEIPWRRGVGIYLTAVVLLGCLSATSAVLLRTHGSLVVLPGGATVLGTDRVDQLTRSRPSFAETFRLYEEIVPPDAVVAVSLPGDSYEYPLFGERLTRTVVPVNSFRAGRITPPDGACYLVFEPALDLQPELGDIDLKNNWLLRKLCP